MCVVIDLDVVCLVCLHHSAEMHSIFSAADEDIQIAQKISTLSKLKVEANNECLPDKICDSCLKDLTAAWRFHKNCQTAVAVFQSILKPLTQQQARPKKLAEKLEEDNNKSETNEQKTDVGENLEPTPSSTVGDRENSSHVITEEEQLLGEKTSNDEFMELDQCVVEEEHEEDYQSIAETADEELELVEYYLTDESPQETATEKILSRVDKTAFKGEEIETSTIASKKLVMNTDQQNGNTWPNTLAKNTVPSTSSQATVARTRQRSLHPRDIPKVAIKPTVLNNRKPNKAMNSGMHQTPVTIDHKQISADQHTENEEDYEDTIKPVKITRKRKATLPGDAKPPKICEICGNSYRFQHALNAHMRRHFQDKPFPCEMCSKAFVSNVELRRHMRVHTGHKPYACQYCDRRFSDFGSRIKHERTHTGERPYVCPTCGKSFAYPHVLSVHLRTHTGEKKFRCDYCTKGFTKKVYLLSHIEQHHSKTVNLNPYELTTLDEDEGADTMEESDSAHQMKAVKFNDCIFTTEFVNESHQTVAQQNDDGEEFDEDGDDNNTMVIQESLLRPKIENVNADDADDDDDDGDPDVQEVEIHLDEYTIKLR